MDSKKKEGLFVEIQKAREYAYLGMYQEAISYFDKGFNKMQDTISSSKQDRSIISEWNDLQKELRDEMDQCKKLLYLISTGKTDFKENKPKQIEDRGIFVISRNTDDESDATEVTIWKRAIPTFEQKYSSS